MDGFLRIEQMVSGKSTQLQIQINEPSIWSDKHVFIFEKT